MEGYGLVIWASDVFAMRLGNGTFDGLNYWNDGETARHSARDTDA
jgi:hypothetical protein